MPVDFEIGFKKLWPGVQGPGFNHSSLQPYTLSCEVAAVVVTRQGPQKWGIRQLRRTTRVCYSSRKEETGEQWMLTWEPGTLSMLKVAQTPVSC